MLKPRPTLNERSEINERREIDARATETRKPRSDEAWTAICCRLRAELGDAIFNSWFARLELETLTEQTAHVSVPTKFLKSWIQAHYAERLLTAVIAEFRDVKDVVISVRSSSRATHLRAAPAADYAPKSAPDFGPGFCDSAAPQRALVGAEAVKGGSAQSYDKAGKRAARDSAETDVLAGSPLDKRLNFSTFLVGRSNQLAHATAQNVAFAGSGEPLSFNPLYIHAAVGLGKTHLLQAIAHAATSAKRRVIYLTAEKFMHGFVAPSRRRRRSPSRRNCARSIFSSSTTCNSCKASRSSRSSATRSMH